MEEIMSRIKDVASENNGFIKTSQIEKIGLSRPMIKKLVDKGFLEKVARGIFILKDEFADEYALLQTRCKYAVFSYGTALYLSGLSDRTPHIYDISIPQGANISTLKNDEISIRCHYVQPDVFELGITEVKSPQGATVKIYDKERCICDLIREKNQIDMQLYTGAIKDYFKSKPNHRKLLKYGKVFGIEEQIRTYMEVL